MVKHAIITGDIVSSKKIAATIRKQLYEDIDTLLHSMKKKWITTYETYRGDSLQCEVKSPSSSLRTGLIIKSFVMSYTPASARKKKSTRKNHIRGYTNSEFDIRLGIGIGGIDFIKKNKITSSDGKAFQLSGEALDSLKQEDQKLMIKTENEKLNFELYPIVLLLDALTSKWTQNQAETIFHKLQNRKDEEIADIFHISLSAVNQRKKNAQWNAIEATLRYYESKIQ